MADISTLTTIQNQTYNIKDKSAIASVTRDGTTFILTKRDGSTEIFDPNYPNFSVVNGQVCITFEQ